MMFQKQASNISDTAAPKEASSKEEAEYKQILSGFGKAVCQHGLDDAVRGLNQLDKTASDVQENAKQNLLKSLKDDYTQGWYTGLKKAYDLDSDNQDVESFLEQEPTKKEASEKFNKGFLDVLNKLVDSNCEFGKVAREGPTSQTSMENDMSNFEDGIEYAAEDLVKRAQSDDVSFGDIAEAARQTTQEDLGKEASDEDHMTKVGAEAASHAFLKNAAAVAPHDVGDEDAKTISAQVTLEGGAIPPASDEYFSGKDDAFRQINKTAQQCDSIGELVSVIDEELNRGFDKEASEQDVHYKCGVDNVCHSFMEKVAFGLAETDLDDEEVFEQAMQDIAKEAEAEAQAAQEEGGDQKKKQPGAIRRGLGWVKQNPGKATAGALGIGALGAGGRELLKAKRRGNQVGDWRQPSHGAQAPKKGLAQGLREQLQARKGQLGDMAQKAKGGLGQAAQKAKGGLGQAAQKVKGMNPFGGGEG